MINRITLTILLMSLSLICFAQVKLNKSYNEVYGKGQPDYNSAQTRTLFSHIVSDKDNSISEDMISNITVVGNFILKDYGKSELIKIELKNPPSVLQSNFLVVVNHQRKMITSFNVDLFYLIKNNLKDSNRTIIVLNNINGGIDLNFVNYKNSRLTLEHSQRLYTNSDCNKINPHSFNLTNVDVNHDGLADIVLKFTVLNYCDKDKNDNETPISSTEITKSLTYKSSISSWRLN